MKNQKGVSLITLVITILVILVLVSITMQTSSDIPDEANFSKYKQELKNVQVGIDNQKIKNAIKGSKEEDLTQGFKKVYLENEPSEFHSFGDIDEPVRGYIADLDYISLTDTELGKKFGDIAEEQVLTFGKKEFDVFVFDADFKVYYVPGLKYKGSMNYSL